MTREPRSREATGVLFGLAAYGVWGFAPAYWKVLDGFPAVEVLAYRVFWSFAIALALLAIRRGFPELLRVLRTPRHALPIATAALLLGVNWLVFIYAVMSDQVIATSLGYYLNPLLSVVLGLVVLGERLRPVQWAAVGIAALGVAQYIVTLGELPWISVALATTFGLYGLVRKLVPVGPIVGFGVETCVLVVPSLAFVAVLLATGRAQLPVGELGFDLFIGGSGLLTAVPLLCFNAAARRLPLVTVGILQYIAPSIALVLAVAVYGETFERVHAWTFGCVWLGLVIFTAESFLRWRRIAMS